MDRTSGAGQVNPAQVAATVRSVINNHQTELGVAQGLTSTVPSAQARNLDYAVADLFGRCFLRVCYWVDVFSSMRRREPLPYVPFTRQPVRSLPAVQPAQVVEADSAGNAIGASPVASA